MKSVMSELFPDDRRYPGGPAREAQSILERTIALYRPRHVYGLFSGGHDSLCAVHVAASHPGFTAAVHIDTQTGVRQTREFVERTCAERGWPLRVYAPPPWVPPPGKRKPGIEYEALTAYEALVLHHGFPGPAAHQIMYTRLKERCLRQLRRDTFGRRRPSGALMLLVGGMRQAESKRRMGNAEEHHVEPGEGRAWCSPLVYWTDDDKEAYLQAAGLARNPVVGRLCVSGECLCGAFARPEEMAELAHAYPEAASYLRSLQARARAAGVHAVWGKAPPAGARKEDPRQLHLCWSCEARGVREGVQGGGDSPGVVS